MMTISPKQILIVYDHRDSAENMRLAIRHHLQALESSEIKHNIVYYNAFDDIPSPSMSLNDLPLEIPSRLHNIKFDLVILHTTFLCNRWSGSFFYKWKQHFSWIGEMACLKLALPQDEYDHSEILDEWLFAWGVSVIFTNFDQTHRKLLYPIMHDKADFYECFTGYLDEATAKQIERKLLPLEARPYDIVYRASHLPYWFGSQGQLKHQIAGIVAERARLNGLKVDISTRVEDRVLGDRWMDFLASGRTVIGCESGSSVIDQRGQIQAQIRAWLKKYPTLSFKEMSRQLPTGWDDHRFFALSPRHFEVIGTKTCQILVEGHYNGVLEADKHYIPLKQDFSNLDEALETLKDHDYVQEMVERAYQDIYLSGKYTYRTLAKLIEQAILDQEQKAPQQIGGHIPLMSEHDEAVETLERQLVAERHQNALLQAKLLDAKGTDFGQLIRQLWRRKKLLILITMIIQSIILVNAIVSTLLAWFITSKKR